MAENIRLVIWDLDDTFWKGTLSEGACTYVDEHHDIVVELARRGIISSICSRNDFATVKQILGGEGLWNYFVFPNIDWSATGADVEQLVEEIRLRPSSVLFIDDNPFNRAEAAEAVPGIEVADETVIRHLLDDPRLQGEDDRELKRLNQYKELERRRDDQRAAGANNLDFLRKCEIRVYIETDVEAHIDRALELINHTSQLNFTKKRLPDDPDEARAELRAYLRQWWIQTGLIYVVDRYGDYGYCGFYAVSGWNPPHLEHFCFSRQILGTGVERFLFNKLGRPSLWQSGAPVDPELSNLDDERRVDWIEGALGAPNGKTPRPLKPLNAQIRLRGGSEIEPLGQYFALVCDRVQVEGGIIREGCYIPRGHAELIRAAYVNPRRRKPLLDFGYAPQDLETTFLDPVEKGAWLVWAPWPMSYVERYEHKETGVRFPTIIDRVWGIDLTSLSDEEFDAKLGQPGLRPEFPDALKARLPEIRENYRWVRYMEIPEIKGELRYVLDRLPAGSRLILWLPIEYQPDGQRIEAAARMNAMIRRLVRDYPAVRLVATGDFVLSADQQPVTDHFERTVYVRIFEHMLRLIETDSGPSAGEEATKAASPAAATAPA